MSILENIEERIICFRTEDGKAPFVEWMAVLPRSLRGHLFIKIKLAIKENKKKVGLTHIRSTHSDHTVYLGYTQSGKVFLLYGSNRTINDRDWQIAQAYWMKIRGGER